MTAINIDELQESTRRANDAKALDVIDSIPDRLREAAHKGEPWTVVMSFFIVPGVDSLSFEGELVHLTGAPRLVHDHLKEYGLNPGLIMAKGNGHMPNQWPIHGHWFKLVARWDNASEDNLLRQIYEASVQARAKEITEYIPELVADAAARGHLWFPVHSFFTAPDLKDLAFDGQPENLKGVARLVYDYLFNQNLQPRLFCTEGEGELGGCEWSGRHYFIVAQWHGTADVERATK